MITKLDKMFENDFIRVPRPFVRRFGLKTAVLLSELYSEYTYWKERGLLDQGGWFYSTVENMSYNSKLSKSQQQHACKELEEYGIIKVKYHGMPKKRYFKFNMKALDKLYNDFEINLSKNKKLIKLDTADDVTTTDSFAATKATDTTTKFPVRKFEGFSF